MLCGEGQVMYGTGSEQEEWYYIHTTKALIAQAIHRPGTKLHSLTIKLTQEDYKIKIHSL